MVHYALLGHHAHRHAPSYYGARLPYSPRLTVVLLLIVVVLSSFWISTLHTRSHLAVLGTVRHAQQLAGSGSTKTAFNGAKPKQQVPAHMLHQAATGDPEKQPKGHQQQLRSPPQKPPGQRPLSAAQQHGHTNGSSLPKSRAAKTASPGTATAAAAAAIPRIIHQNYLAGQQQLLRDSLRPMSHFRKEWQHSCKTHHPGWSYMFWDEARCEQLLTADFPWFLPTWRALGNSTVLKSDAIRPFILHKHGGVMLDLDSECYTDMGPWLSGAQVVLQAEAGHTINNAQMASIPGHTVWSHFQKAIQARVAAGKRWPLEATGPYLLTDVVRVLISRTRGDLPGRYTLPGGSHVAVYGPKQWFTPCAWNDWDCAVKLACERPWAASKAAAAAAAAAARAATTVAAELAAHQQRIAAAGRNSSLAVTPAAAAAAAAAVAAGVGGFPFMLDVEGVAGVHHFSGSWLGLDGSKSLSLRKEGMSGVLSFLYTGAGFVEQPCRQLHLLPTSLEAAVKQRAWLGTDSGLAAARRASAASEQQAPVTVGASPPPPLSHVPMCQERIAAVASAGKCSVVSVRVPPAHCSVTPALHPQQQAAAQAAKVASNATHTNTQQQQPSEQAKGASFQQESIWFGAEYALAAAGCQIKLVTPRPFDFAATVKAILSGGAATSGSQHRHRQAETAVLGNASSTGSSRQMPSNKDVAAVLGRISSVTAAVAATADPFAEPPVYTLDGLLEPDQRGGGSSSSRTTLLLLHLDPFQACPCACSKGSAASSDPSSLGCRQHGCAATTNTLLDVLNALYISSSEVLQAVDSVVLVLPQAPAGAAHKAFAAYQHLYQEAGFVGYFHQAVLQPVTSTPAFPSGSTVGSIKSDAAGSAGQAGGNAADCDYVPSWAVLGLARHTKSL